MTCNHNCDQGRTCTCLPITMEDDEPFSFDVIAGLIRDMLAGVGLITCLVLLAFYMGYTS